MSWVVQHWKHLLFVNLSQVRNSILQCLLHLNALTQAFYNQDHFQNTKQRHLSQNYYQILKQLIQNTSINPINPSSFKRTLGMRVPRFLGSAQQDAQQCLTAILESLNQELSRVTDKPKYQQLESDPTKKSLASLSQIWWEYYKKRDNSIVTDLFCAQILSKVSCNKCKTVSVTFDNIWGLPMDLGKKNESIPQLLDHQFGLEVEIEDYNCWKCKQFRRCSRSLSFFRLPKILIIQLKRFQYRAHSRQKIKTSINIQKHLNLKQFVCSESPNQICEYRLSGVVHHFGQTDYGHYIATVFDQKNKKWYDMNDSKFQENNNFDGPSQTAYLLFYQRL